MRFPFLFAFGLCVSTAWAQPTAPNDVPPTQEPLAARQTPRAPRRGTPQEQIEADLREFLRVLNGLEGKGILNGFQVGAHISGARVGYFGASEWEEYFVAARGQTTLGFESVEFENLTPDSARVKLNYTRNSVAPVLQVVGEAPRGGEKIGQKESETLELRREKLPWDRNKEIWRIVPPLRGEFPAYQMLSPRHVAYYSGQRAGTLSQLRGEISAMHLKQCALGVLQFVQDYDEIYRLENEFWREAVRPYVQKDSVFAIPGGHGFYTFNNNLSDKSNNLAQREKTVLFYEGEDEEPVFRYDNRAAICFADGHVELITRAQEQALIWKPRAP